jgi:cytochrome c peroxidase
VSISGWIHAEEEADPPEIAIGERLFLETRFAQSYHAKPGKADPALSQTVTTTEPLQGPFAGKTMNCRACHMVDEHQNTPGGGMRTYADFAHLSPVPNRNDGQHRTGRNSMVLVNITLPGKHGELFHFDGEFNSMQDLVHATLTGRNYGWKPAELHTAIRHIATVIRNDDGKGELAREFGGSYTNVLTGSDKAIPAEFRLPAEYRVAVKTASDQQIVDAVAKLIAAYVSDLAYQKDNQGNYTGSPYDHFLALNNLPRKPRPDETTAVYSQRLLNAVNKLDKPQFVAANKQSFAYHKQSFAFGKNELAGMKLFFTAGDQKRPGGNCVSCHTAPHFSDFSFHNTGLTQVSYDEAHGAGAFNKLTIPKRNSRNKSHNAYLPATASHPEATGRFRSTIDHDRPELVDLGMWNIYANPDYPKPQQKLHRILCDEARLRGIKQCTQDALLQLSIASFKTPVLRDLGHSNPYMHNGKFTTLKEAVAFYITSSQLARSKTLRNADPRLANIQLNTTDIDMLVAFIQSLNEDYD